MLSVNAMEGDGNFSGALFSLDGGLSAVAHYFTSLPLHPVFSTVHFIATAIALRKEPGTF